jgi:hypothetical protein
MGSFIVGQIVERGWDDGPIFSIRIVVTEEQFNTLYIGKKVKLCSSED